MTLDAIDKQIINELQGGFPITENPWASIAAHLGIDSTTLIKRIELLQDNGYISRFGPLYDAQKMGGGLSLAALRAEPEDYKRVSEIVNSFNEVAHNYERDHPLNMWFVIATEHPYQVDQTIEKIEFKTGCKVLNMPKQEEYFLGLQLRI